MLLTRMDESGQVFYIRGEDELKTVSIRGAQLKSPERIYYRDDRTYQSKPFAALTPLPMKTTNQVMVINNDAGSGFRMVSPTPMPTATQAPKYTQSAAPTPTSTPQP